MQGNSGIRRPLSPPIKRCAGRQGTRKGDTGTRDTPDPIASADNSVHRRASDDAISTGLSSFNAQGTSVEVAVVWKAHNNKDLELQEGTGMSPSISSPGSVSSACLVADIRIAAAELYKDTAAATNVIAKRGSKAMPIKI